MHAPDTTTALRVAPLQRADVDAYRRLMLEGYRDAADAFVSTTEERAAQPVEWWLRRIADPSGLSVAFGAFDGDTLIGTVAVEFTERAKIRHKALLVGMYVAQSHRNTGAGRALMRAAIDCAAARPGVRAIMLTVTDGNGAASRLYRSFGFTAFGMEPMAILTASGYKAKALLWLPLGEDQRRS